MDHEPEQQSKRRSPLVLILIIIIVLLAAAAVVLAVGKFGGQEPEPESDGEGTPVIGYEEGVTALDEDSLQKAVDEAYRLAAQEGVAISYQNDAYSKDGETFTCYIANPAESPVDMYIDIYADAELTDEIYLSKLIPPGNAKNEIKLNRRLVLGNHLVYLVITQVEDDHQTIRQQVVLTMDFHVEK